jgi:hypothetical protein
METFEWLTAILVTIVIRFYYYLQITMDNTETSNNSTAYYSMDEDIEPTADQSRSLSIEEPISTSTPNTKPIQVIPATSTPVSRIKRDLPITVFEIKEEDTRRVIDVVRLGTRLRSPTKTLVLESVLATEISPASEYYNQRYRYVPARTEIGKKLLRI